MNRRRKDQVNILCLSFIKRKLYHAKNKRQFITQHVKIINATSQRRGSIHLQTYFYMNMETNGNITSMPGVGTLAYENSAEPYQVTMLTLTGTAVPISDQSVRNLHILSTSKHNK